MPQNREILGALANVFMDYFREYMRLRDLKKEYILRRTNKGVEFTEKEFMETNKENMLCASALLFFALRFAEYTNSNREKLKINRDRFVEVQWDTKWRVGDLRALGGEKSALSFTPLWMFLERFDVSISPKDRKEKVRDINYMDNLRCGDIIDALV